MHILRIQLWQTRACHSLYTRTPQNPFILHTTYPLKWNWTNAICRNPRPLRHYRHYSGNPGRPGMPWISGGTQKFLCAPILFSECWETRRGFPAQRVSVRCCSDSSARRWRRRRPSAAQSGHQRCGRSGSGQRVVGDVPRASRCQGCPHSGGSPPCWRRIWTRIDLLVAARAARRPSWWELMPMARRRGAAACSGSRRSVWMQDDVRRCYFRITTLPIRCGPRAGPHGALVYADGDQFEDVPISTCILHYDNLALK